MGENTGCNLNDISRGLCARGGYGGNMLTPSAVLEAHLDNSALPHAGATD